MRGVVARLVKENLAEAAADDGRNHDVEDKVDETFRLRSRRGAPQAGGLHQRDGIGPAAQESHDIRQRIPADGEGAEADSDRIDRRERQDKDRHEERTGFYPLDKLCSMRDWKIIPFAKHMN